jgi:FAD/FMN-containing dehydrogenase
MPYPDLFPPEAEGFRPRAAVRTMFRDPIDGHAAAAMIEHVRAARAPMAAVQLRVLGGAMARVPADATAFAHRDRPLMVNVAAMYQRPEEREIHEAWVAGVAAGLDTGDAAAYSGFLGDEGEDRVRAAYPGAAWDRLRTVKARYDPDNLFRLNHNIPPA